MNTNSSEAVPGFLGLAALLRKNLAGEDLGPLCQSLIDRASRDASDSAALLDAGIIFQLLGNQELASHLQGEALKSQRHYCLPSAQPTKLRLLALMAPGDMMSNVPIECLLEHSDVELHLYYASSQLEAQLEVPDHDVLFVAISESADNRPILDAWQDVLAAWPRPVLNNPRHIPRVARDAAYRLLHRIPGVAMPPTARLGRAQVEQLAQQADGVFPLIVRPLDSHAGHDLYKIDDAADLLAKLQDMPGEEFYVSPFIDYRSADGLFRKYRVVLVEGRPYACHMGISSHWMIHYLNAGMADSAEKRAEEAAFMATFDEGFAQRHGAALAGICQAIGLDYLGIDCAETPEGDLLIFEVDHAMVVHAMDPVDVFPYKQPTMHKLFAAFRDMLQRAAATQAQG